MANYEKFIGIDVSKKKFDVCISNREGKESKQFTQSNDRKGFEKFLKEIGEATQKEKVIVCLEHTGLYAYPLCAYLEQEQIPYVIESPLRIKRSEGIVRGKNDSADARKICRFIRLHHTETELSKLPAKLLQELQLLLSLRDRLVKARTMLETSAKEVREMLEGSIVKQVDELNNKAVERLKKQISLVEKKIELMVRQDEELKKKYELARTVIGIGPQTAAFLLVITRGFTAFPTARKFACYAGVAPFEHTSGTSIRGRTKVSKMANKKIKSLLHSAANSAIQHDPQLRRYYDRKMSEGKHYRGVINAIKNKLITRVFAVVKRQEAYVALNY